MPDPAQTGQSGSEEARPSRQVGSASPWQAARILELEQQRARLLLGLADVRAELERVAGSRTWRWGHAASRTLRRLSGRRASTGGALSRALAQIDRLTHSPDVSGSRVSRSAQGESPAPPGQERVTSFCVKIGASGRETAERGGDIHFARALRTELGRRGHPCRIQTREEWEDLAGLEDDVVLHLRGRGRSDPTPGQLNVLWCISHPDELSPLDCDVHDLVCVASERFADSLRPQTRTPVIVLEQATDPQVFHPRPDPRFRHELVFVGNSRGVFRPIVRDVLASGHEPAVYGGGWDGMIDRRLIRSEYVPNRELHRVYSSAGLVLCDHWEDMRRHGFISNRVFDALACGAVLISDDLPEVRSLFDGVVSTYRTPEQLSEIIDGLLADPDERARRAAAGRDLVLGAHTFTHRVGALLAEIEGVRARIDRPLSAARR